MGEIGVKHIISSFAVVGFLLWVGHATNSTSAQQIERQDGWTREADELYSHRVSGGRVFRSSHGDIAFVPDVVAPVRSG